MELYIVRHGQTDWNKLCKFQGRVDIELNENGEEAASAKEMAGEKLDKKKTLILNEETIDRYIMCDQCHPIPGDDVLGYIEPSLQGEQEGAHIVIHKRQCEVAKRLKASDGNRILAAKWDTHGKLYFPATLHIEGFDRVGVLHQITGILSQQLNVNMHSLHIDTNDGLFTAEINLGVHDVKDIQTICRDLKGIEEIEDVRRF